MGLSEDQKKFIRENFRKVSIRRIAKQLNCSRPEAEKYIIQLSQEQRPVSLSLRRLVPSMSAFFLTLFLFSLTVLTYSNSIRYPFVWDDHIQIEHNPLLENVSGKGGLWDVFKAPVGVIPGKRELLSFSYRPVQTLSYYFSKMLVGMDPKFYHATNVVLQGMAACFLFLLLCRLLQDREIAFWVSAVFAVHPVQIAAVTYVSGRAESLAIIFMLVSFYFFLESKKILSLKKLMMLGLSALSFFIALLAKEISIVLPVVIFGSCYILTVKKSEKITLIDCLVFSGTALLYLLIRVNVLGNVGQGQEGGLAMDQRVLTALASVPRYLKLLFLPYGLHMDYVAYSGFAEGPVVVMGILTVIALIYLVWLSRHLSSAFFGWIWFGAFFLPVLNIFIPLNAPMAEHWLYNALIGFFIVVVSFLLMVADTRPGFNKAIECVFALFVLVMAGITFYSQRIWGNEVALYRNVLKYNRDDCQIYSNLGSAYAEKGMFKEAEEYLTKALQMNPNMEMAKENLEMVRAQRRK